MTHVLTYDTLPAHSRLRREHLDGVLRITAAAEEPGPMVRRTALIRSALPAGVWFVAILLGCFAIFGMMYQANRRGLSQELVMILQIAFIIFCIALFALIWRTHYTARLEAATTALQQSTLIAASPGRLLIETAGPLGSASHDLTSSPTNLSITTAAHPTLRLDCLEIRLADGSRIHCLAGRDEQELRWLAKAISQAMQMKTG